MSYKTISSILGSTWLISNDYVQANLGLVMKMVSGETVDFGLAKPKDTEPRVILIGSGISGLAAAEKMASVYGVSYYTKLESIPQGSIAQVDIIGPVLKYGDECSYGMVDQAALITKLANQGNISGIILNIDSPGGQASGTAMLADVIKAAGQVKPVLAVIQDGTAASAAMWIASAASEIYVTNNTSKVGSVGVYTTLADWYEYAKKQGLNIRDVYAPQSTDKNGEYRAALAGDEGPLKENLAELADAFIGTIQANRAGKLTGDAYTTGKMFNGKQATKLGLIDGVKPYGQVVQRMEKMITARQNQKTNMNVAFASVMAAAAISEIAVVDGGFLLTEDQLNTLETFISGKNTELATAGDTITGLQATVKEKDDALAAVADHQATITGLNETIVAKDAEIEKLKGGPAAAFTNTSSTGDHLTETGEKKNLTSYDLEMQKIVALKESK